MIEGIDILGNSNLPSNNIILIDDTFIKTLEKELKKHRIVDKNKRKLIIEKILDFGYIFYCEHFSYVNKEKSKLLSDFKKIIENLTDKLKNNEIKYQIKEGLKEGVKITYEKIRKGHKIQYLKISEELLLLKIERHPNLYIEQYWIYKINEDLLLRLNNFESFYKKIQKNPRTSDNINGHYYFRNKFFDFLKKEINFKFSKKIKKILIHSKNELLNEVPNEINDEVIQIFGINVKEQINNLNKKLEIEANIKGKKKTLEGKGNFIMLGPEIKISFIDSSGKEINQKLKSTPLDNN